jgi:hypothetical protein
MAADRAASTQATVDDALRRLVADPHTREHAIDAIEQAVASAYDPERAKLRVLAWIHREELEACVDRLLSDGYAFDDIRDDSPEAHRKVADIQRILAALGYEIGPTGVDGYTGGPAGKPVALDLDETARLVQRAAPAQKLLAAKPEGPTESWTRDATRRLQLFLGRSGLPDERADLRAGCLVRPDGLFGSRTLAGVSAFLMQVTELGRPGAPGENG